MIRSIIGSDEVQLALSLQSGVFNLQSMRTHIVNVCVCVSVCVSVEKGVLRIHSALITEKFDQFIPTLFRYVMCDRFVKIEFASEIRSKSNKS